MPAMPLTYNLIAAQGVGREERHPVLDDAAGEEHVDSYGGRGKCRRCNTCEVCPTGARYSPDFTFKQLLDAEQDPLHDRTLGPAARCSTDRRRASPSRGGAKEDGPRRRTTSNTARGRSSSPPATAGARTCCCCRPNRGFRTAWPTVGSRRPVHDRPLAYQTTIELDAQDLSGHERAAQPDLAAVLPLRPTRPVRAPRSAGLGERRRPRAAAARRRAATLLLGDALVDDWRTRTARGTARVRGYYDVHPDTDSRLTLDPATKNRWGDPLPTIQHRARRGDDRRAAPRPRSTSRSCSRSWRRRTTAASATSAGSAIRIIPPAAAAWAPIRPPASSTATAARTITRTCSSSARRRCPTGGCTNGTLTFVALALRSATEIAK